MTLLVVVTGPPGAGKSTVARMVADRLHPSVVVAGDAFFGFLASGAIEPWLPESAHQNEVVTEAAARATGRFVAAGYGTVYDGVIGPWLIDRFLAAAALDTAQYAVLLPGVDRCLTRVSERVGHGFDDEEATRKMHHEFATAGIDGRHVLSNAEEPARQTADHLLTMMAEDRLVYRRRDVGP